MGETSGKRPLLARLHGPGAREAAGRLAEALRSGGYETVRVPVAADAMSAGGVRLDGDPYRVSMAMSQQERLEATFLDREGADAVVDAVPPLDTARRLGTDLSAPLDRFDSMPPERSASAARRVSSARALDAYVGGPDPEGAFLTEEEALHELPGALSFPDAASALGDGTAKGSPLLVATVAAIEGLDRAEARSETVAGVREALAEEAAPRPSRDGGRRERFVTVQLPAGSVRAVRNGRLRGTLPYGTTVAGRDLGGFSFFANATARRTAALSEGRPVNFAFPETRAVHLSRWDAGTKGYLDAEADPWELTKAVKARREGLEPALEEVHGAPTAAVAAPAPPPRPVGGESR